MNAPVEQRHRDEAARLLRDDPKNLRPIVDQVAQALADRDAENERLRTFTTLVGRALAEWFENGPCFCSTDPGEEPTIHEQWCDSLRVAWKNTETRT